MTGRRRQLLHNSIMRGRLDYDVLQSLAASMLKDLDREIRHARNDETKITIRTIRARAEEKTRQFLIDIQAILYVPLAEGQTFADRTAIGIQAYEEWRHKMDQMLDQARRA